MKAEQTRCPQEAASVWTVAARRARTDSRRCATARPTDGVSVGLGEKAIWAAGDCPNTHPAAFCGWHHWRVQRVRIVAASRHVADCARAEFR